MEQLYTSIDINLRQAAALSEQRETIHTYHSYMKYAVYPRLNRHRGFIITKSCTLYGRLNIKRNLVAW